MTADTLWLLISAAMIFFMQAGFLCLESGLVRRREAEVVALKNLFDWALTVPCFALVGFALMFGSSIGGFVGGSLFGLSGIEATSSPTSTPLVFVLFQLSFAGTATTIVFGAISGRASFQTYLAASITMAILVYPVIGHWAWGDLVYTDNSPWLIQLGFIDFAGSTVVHSTGGWFGLIVALLLGPRMGRFDRSGRPQTIESDSFQIAALGTLILWFGWWGFNGGSLLGSNESIGLVLLNTNLAGAAATLAATAHCILVQNRSNLPIKTMGGGLGGLVAITASANLATPGAAVAIGALAGIIHNLVYDALLSAQVDDPVGAVPIHLACGIWGTLAVAFVAPNVTSPATFIHQFSAQGIGVLACGLWTSGIAYLTVGLVRRTFGIRLSPQHELSGINLYGSSPTQQHDASPDEAEMSTDELRDLMRGR